MFITRTERKVDIFYLDRNNEKADFENLLNDPTVSILGKQYLSQTETTYEGEMSTSMDRPYVRVEYEVCSL